MTEASQMDKRDRFAANLRRARKAAGVSQEELAGRCELHRTEVSLLERGGREPRLGTMIKLATALDTTAEALVTGIGWDPQAREYKIDEPGEGA
jgi:transcriptional regulator with XRE-family HTH domain